MLGKVKKVRRINIRKNANKWSPIIFGLAVTSAVTAYDRVVGRFSHLRRGGGGGRWHSVGDSGIAQKEFSIPHTKKVGHI